RHGHTPPAGRRGHRRALDTPVLHAARPAGRGGRRRQLYGAQTVHAHPQNRKTLGQHPARVPQPAVHHHFERRRRRPRRAGRPRTRPPVLHRLRKHGTPHLHVSRPPPHPGNNATQRNIPGHRRRRTLLT